MTPTLWAALYIYVVVVFGAILMGWTDGVWRHQNDVRERRVYEMLEREYERQWPPRNPRRFQHRNLRAALQARGRIKMGVR